MGKTVLITGANRGIGLAMCRALVARGDNVIAAVRSASPELSALDARIEPGVDVTDRSALKALRERLAGSELDWLICNAGLLRPDTLETLEDSDIRAQIEVNALAPLMVVRQLLDLLRHGSKVGLVTSRMGSLADNTSGGMYGYRMSKAALNMAGVSLAHDLAPRGAAVVLLHPGYVRTEMTRGSGNIEPDEAARGLITRMDNLTPADSGKFFHQSGEELPW